jgi:hypothetical protein
VHLHTAFARAERSQVPWLSVDGSPVPAVWGRNELVVRVGPRRVGAATHLPHHGGAELGRVEEVVEVPRRGVAEVWWRGPALARGRGRLGPAPQRPDGLVRFWVLMASLGVVLPLGLVGFVARLVG